MLGRRGVLAGAVGLAALSACDTDDLRPPQKEAGPTPSSSGSVTVEPDADSRLAGDLASEIAAALVWVERAGRQYPRLRKRLQPLARMHRAHLDVLGPPDHRSVPAPPPAPSAAAAAASVRTVEETLRTRLTSGAVAAQSGAFARLLASMSASVSQHLAVLG